MLYYSIQPADRVLYDNWKETTEDWFCQWKYKGMYRKLYIPAGRKYDGASVPRIAWTTVGIRPDGEIRAGSLAHDELYRSKGGRNSLRGGLLTNAQGNMVWVSRKEADWVFREFMKFATVKRRQCTIAWIAVRVFGWRYWGKESPSGKGAK